MGATLQTTDRFEGFFLGIDITAWLPADRSWKIKGDRKPVRVMPVFEGLEANAAFADTFVSHIEDAAHDAGIALRPFQ